MSTTVRYSDREPSNVSSSVQKRRTLYLAASDPRAKSDFVNSKYANQYYGEVVVLPTDVYLDMLKKQLGGTADDGTEIVIDPSLDPAKIAFDAGTLSTSLHAPTNLYWDFTDPNATQFVSNSGSNTINIKITFDPAIDDVASDGSVTYAYDVNIGAPSASGTKGTVTTGTATVGTVTTEIKTSSQIKLSWKALSDATGYNVNVTGKNQNNNPTDKAKDYHSNAAISSNGKHYFTITPAAGKSFTGTYKFSIQVKYTNGASKAVVKNVTI
jgi:hypothetical protein